MHDIKDYSSSEKTESGSKAEESRNHLTENEHYQYIDGIRRKAGNKFLCVEGELALNICENRILKRKFNGNMKSLRKSLTVFLPVTLIFGMAWGLAACGNNDIKVNLKDTVSFDGIDYVLQEDIGLDFSGFNGFNEGIGELCEKVGSIRNVDVYKIKGLEQSEWIFLDDTSMLSSNGPYGGVYLSSKVRMDRITEFKPDYLRIYYLTPPTSEQSGTQLNMFSTADLNVIDKAVKAIANGKPVTDKKREEVAKAMLHGDSSYRNYRLEFLSGSYQKLVYRLDYTEDANGKFYIGYYGDITDYKIIEIDSTLHEFLPADESLGE